MKATIELNEAALREAVSEYITNKFSKAGTVVFKASPRYYGPQEVAMGHDISATVEIDIEAVAQNNS